MKDNPEEAVSMEQTYSPCEQSQAPWNLKRVSFFIAGITMTGIGIIGAVLPVLPTTPFLIVALACFTRSSPRLEKWLLNHRTFGPPLRDCRERGAISKRAKILASTMMALSFAIFVALRTPSIAIAAVCAVTMLGGAAFIWTRPD